MTLFDAAFTANPLGTTQSAKLSTSNDITRVDQEGGL
jgi:hypothetical protein